MNTFGNELFAGPTSDPPKSETDDTPILPPEVERMCFEYSALSDRSTNVTLLLVAQRVRTWYAMHKSSSRFSLAVILIPSLQARTTALP